MNVLHFLYSNAAPTSTDCVNIATKLAQQMGTGVLSQFPASTVLTEVICTDIGSANGFQGVWSGSEPGVNTGNALASSSAFVVNFIVNARYRGGHPRAYFPPMTSQALLDPSKWVASNAATYLGDIKTALQGMAGFVSGATTITEQVAVSYYQGGTWKPDQNGRYHWVPTRRSPPISLPVVSYSYYPLVGSQRRRVKVG
jgi:hypothetical protein